MATIPKPPASTTPTIDKILEIMQAENRAEPARDYLGASAMGHDCDRHLYYMANGFPQREPHPKALTASQGGYRAEPVIIDRFQKVPGIELISHQPDGTQYEFSDFGGKFKGHPDGFILGLLEAPKTWHIFEIKEKEEKFFRALQKLIQEDPKKALEKWSYEYYIQAQIYMRKFNLTRHYLVCCTPGAREMVSCRTDLNISVADAMIARAKRIIDMTQPPPREFKDETHFKCRFCAYNMECWR